MAGWPAPASDAQQSVAIKRQAIRALATISADGSDKFARLVKLSGELELREEAIKALLTVPTNERDAKLATQLSDSLITEAEATPIDARTSDRFIDAAQLAESLLPALPTDASRTLRQRWQAISVRVVRIKTVEEEMRYDLKYFAVEAGRPVEIVLQNADLMPHNLVITEPGALKEIAMLAAKMAPDQALAANSTCPKILASCSLPAWYRLANKSVWPLKRRQVQGSIRLCALSPITGCACMASWLSSPTWMLGKNNRRLRLTP